MLIHWPSLQVNSPSPQVVSLTGFTLNRSRYRNRGSDWTRIICTPLGRGASLDRPRLADPCVTLVVPHPGEVHVMDAWTPKLERGRKTPTQEERGLRGDADRHTLRVLPVVAGLVLLLPAPTCRTRPRRAGSCCRRGPRSCCPGTWAGPPH